MRRELLSVPCRCLYCLVVVAYSSFTAARLFTDTESALRNIAELKLIAKIVMQYLRSTLLLPVPVCTPFEVQAAYDLLLYFVTSRPAGETLYFKSMTRMTELSFPCSVQSVFEIGLLVVFVCGICQSFCQLNTDAHPGCAVKIVSPDEPCFCCFPCSVADSSRSANFLSQNRPCRPSAC